MLNQIRMKLINKTKNTTIAENIIEAKSLKDQSMGLLKYKTPTAMLIKTRFGIHTFFMKYPIDVLVLDKQNRIAQIKENLQPNKLFVWNPKYETILELPLGAIKQSKTQLHDQINLL
jgi:uncharacterized protein